MLEKSSCHLKTVCSERSESQTYSKLVWQTTCVNTLLKTTWFLNIILSEGSDSWNKYTLNEIRHERWNCGMKTVYLPTRMTRANFTVYSFFNSSVDQTCQSYGLLEYLGPCDKNKPFSGNVYSSIGLNELILFVFWRLTYLSSLQAT